MILRYEYVGTTTMRPITGANGNIGTVQKERTTNIKRNEILIMYIKNGINTIIIFRLIIII